MKKNTHYKKYNFSDNTNTKSSSNSGSSLISKKGIYEIVKEYVIKFWNFLKYQWLHNRFAFILCVCMLFLLCYYVYVQYIKEEDKEEDEDEANNKALDDFVKTKTKKKKTIPKKHETRCRIIMEELFKAPFKMVRPDFLKYDKTGKNLELDMYNEDLKLALEYDGVHHRKFTEFFHKTEQDFTEQKERDEYKENKCRELGITLIRVPDTVKYDDLESFIKSELDKKGIKYLQ